MQFTFFHLMPWLDLTEPPTEWPAPNGPFNGERGTELYADYISTMPMRNAAASTGWRRTSITFRPTA
jgi:hypothetical protein